MVAFAFFYLLATYLVVPNIAPIFGRERIKESDLVQAHSFFYRLANRNYVRTELNDVIQNVAYKFEKQNDGIKLIYLDANFPFFDGFPLLPHLSHNDGRKVDISFVYKHQNGQLTNMKPSVSGYGIYQEPTADEYDQILKCKGAGYWQYDFPKYLTFARINNEIAFSEEGTQELVNKIANQKEVSKIFIEPHLRGRLGLIDPKIRFHGCRAVRHDDHIHFQIR
ncbi:hypothetical protein [Tunicatimonas pelagia]|uniref:hypothetical protein n=1 Tax=Tunicatimonas pelagia TaxID=931531 RepID=UPI0026657F41|nr:hypothetical protein [Tunicatimonas pelagia]WKN45737.1 hypothetical protein P0M28_12295 [Tunicatimonas pelagia]